MRTAEIRMIEFALECANGNVVTAAAALGLPHATLYRRCRALSIGPYGVKKQALHRYPKGRKKGAVRKMKTVAAPATPSKAAAKAPIGTIGRSPKEEETRRKVERILQEEDDKRRAAIAAGEPLDDEDDEDDEDDDADEGLEDLEDPEATEDDEAESDEDDGEDAAEGDEDTDGDPKDHNE
jgi:hypothetical protein